MIGEGSVGGEFATMFTMFINNKLDKLVTPKDVLTNNSWEYIKGQLKSCIGEGNNYRADIASLMTTRIINYAVHYSNNNTVTQPLIDRVTNLITDDIFSNDLKYYIVKGILNGNKQKWSKLMLNPEVIKMTVK
jgi:predicted DNA binding protein